MAGCKQGQASGEEMTDLYSFPFTSGGSIQQPILQYWLTDTVFKSYSSFQGTTFRKY